MRVAFTALVLPVLAMIAATAHAQPVEQVVFQVEQVVFQNVELGEVEVACGILPGPGLLQSLEIAPPFFIRGIRIGPSALGEDMCDNVPGQTTPTTLPRNLSADEQIAFDVELVATELDDFNEMLFVNGQHQADVIASVDETSGCGPTSTAHCLNDGRFKVRSHWRTTFGTRGTGPAVQGASTNDSGLFYFFNQDNWEVLLKVLDACSTTPPRFWVFSAATTNVEYTITVVDTEAQPNQVAKSYFKPQGPPAPAITDTNAFATCP